MDEFKGMAGDRSRISFDRPIYPRSYQPSPPIPRWFRRGLIHKGGRNEHGDANFIVSWGMDARDERGRIKYMNPHDYELGWACFILERWAPPSFYDKEEWNRLRYDTELVNGEYADLLGPFPRQGRYIYVGALATVGEDGLPYEMLPLTSAVLDDIRKQIGYGGLNQNKALARLAMHKELRKVRAQKELRKALDDNKEEWKKRKDAIIANATRHTVAPSIDFPIKSNLDEARKLFIPQTEGVTHGNAASSAQ